MHVSWIHASLIQASWTVPNRYSIPEVFFNTRSVPDLFSKSSGISGIGYFKILCFWHGKRHQGGTRYHLISSSFDLTGLAITSMYCGLISMGLSSITISPLCFHRFSVGYYGKLFPAPNWNKYQRWRNSTRVCGNNLLTRFRRKMWPTELKFGDGREEEEEE